MNAGQVRASAVNTTQHQSSAHMTLISAQYKQSIVKLAISLILAFSSYICHAVGFQIQIVQMRQVPEQILLQQSVGS